MATDRELLELAAKAAGYNFQWEPALLNEWPEPMVFSPEGFGQHWNPLTDDGDALRLAVKLEIEVRNFNGDSHAGQRDKFWCTEKWFIYGTDPYSTTRRAIVRAAAALTAPTVGASSTGGES